MEILLVEWLQHHSHRPLEQFVLERRNADGPRAFTIAFRDMHSTYRRGLVRTALGALQ
ncbi:hypothetical protein D3C84_667260 [compost metagenome]